MEKNKKLKPPLLYFTTDDDKDLRRMYSSDKSEGNLIVCIKFE